MKNSLMPDVPIRRSRARVPVPCPVHFVFTSPRRPCSGEDYQPCPGRTKVQTLLCCLQNLKEDKRAGRQFRILPAPTPPIIWTQRIVSRPCQAWRALVAGCALWKFRRTFTSRPRARPGKADGGRRARARLGALAGDVTRRAQVDRRSPAPTVFSSISCRRGGTWRCDPSVCVVTRGRGSLDRAARSVAPRRRRLTPTRQRRTDLALKDRLVRAWQDAAPSGAAQWDGPRPSGPRGTKHGGRGGGVESPPPEA